MRLSSSLAARRPLVALAALSLSFSGSASAQPSADLQHAVVLIQQQDWEAAAESLDAALAETPENPAIWYRLAQVRRGQERWADALSAIGKAEELEFPNPVASGIVRAEALAALGRTDDAFASLEVVAAAGANRPILVRAESGPGFEEVRDDPRWAGIVERLTPCASEEFRRFDFWIGDFRVVHPTTGVLLGENSVTTHLDGCMLMESWRSAGAGQKGMSMNFFDPSDGSWNQIYLDNNGLPANWPPLKGGLDEDGAMVLLTPEGENRSRWTWTEVDERTVRQMAETTADGGETWQVVWDSHYVRKGEPAESAASSP